MARASVMARRLTYGILLRRTFQDRAHSELRRRESCFGVATEGKKTATTETAAGSMLVASTHLCSHESQSYLARRCER